MSYRRWVDMRAYARGKQRGPMKEPTYAEQESNVGPRSEAGATSRASNELAEKGECELVHEAAWARSLVIEEDSRLSQR